MELTKYEEFSHARKQLQLEGLAPNWYSTAGYQLLVNKNYLNLGETPWDMYHRVAKRAADLTKVKIPEDFGYKDWYSAFLDITWKGYLSPSTTVLTNMGNDRGHPVSCAGTYLGDSIRAFGEARLEIEQLTQRGYGTSWSLDPVRHRGSPISKGGTATGIMHPADDIVQSMRKVTQGDSRRGNIGQYVNPLHYDFDELVDQLISDHDGWNIGWNYKDEFDDLFKKDPKEADRRWKRMLKTKMQIGKGYYFFIDKVNRNRPQMYIDKGFNVRHSNLCGEITLMNDKDHSFSCVLSSMNVSRYDEWKDTKAIQISTVFLDAVIEDMLIKAKEEEGFEKIVAFTEKSRAIGLGVLGLSTYYQQKNWIYGDFESTQFNQIFFKELKKEALEASKWLAKEVGEPEWLTGYGRRFSHLIALPPTKSTAIIQGGISEGINPNFANVFEQDTAGGTVYRINPVLLPIMKDRGKYTKEVMARISESQGSVQGEDWLSEHEKKVFRTAFELNQETILRMGSDRQRVMGTEVQSQSLNLYIPAEEKEEEIARLHHIGAKDEYIHTMYYIHSLNEESVYKVDKDECVACNG